MPGPELEFDAKKLKDEMIDESPGIPEDFKEDVKGMVKDSVTLFTEALEPIMAVNNERLANLETVQKAQADLIIQASKKLEEFEIFAWEFKRDMLDSFIDNYTVLKASGGAVPDHYIPNLKSQSEQCSQALRELSK